MNKQPSPTRQVSLTVPRSEMRGVFERPKGSGIWWARWWESGKERRKKVGTLAQARDYYLSRKFLRGACSPHFRTWSLQEAMHRLLQVSNYQSHTYESHARHFQARFDGLRLDQITRGDIKSWRAQRLKEVKPATVAHQVAFLHHVFKQAIEDGWPGENPAKRLSPKFDNRRVIWLTPEQEARLRAELAPELWPFVEFAIITGLRKAEQWRLEWSDIHGATLWVLKSKTHARRGVPLCARAVRILEARQALDTPFPGDKGWTFKVFRGACRRAGLPRFTWHGLRHTFASRLVQAGTPLSVVQKLLGHATITMTERYAHLAPGALQDAVRLFDREDQA